MQRWNSKREMMGDDPPYLAVGTEVSAKYKGAFCEAKVRKIVRSVKCKVAYKLGLGTATVTDDQIKGTLRAGATVEVRHSEKKEYVEAVITKIQDCSQYTVVFDDGDITTLRRTALCLKSGRHFAESETLDQLPLTHPEHFGNPVIGGRRGRRNRQDESSDDEEPVRKGKRHKEEKEADIGKVVCVEVSEKKKQKDNWFPGLVVAPTAQDTVRIHVREDYLVRSFKDGRYYTVPKKEATPFTREIGLKVDNNTLRIAVDKALLFLDKDELPPHWDRELLFGLDESSGSDSDAPFDSDTSDDEPREEKDHFVAQLYKFMDDRGTPINKGPIISMRDVDLYKLFKVVHKLGGYNRVTNHNQWKTVSHKLGFGQNGTTVNLVKHAYKKFLHSFEDFYRKLGCTMVNHPRGQRSRHRSNRSLIRDKDRTTTVVKEKPVEKEPEEVKEVPPVEIKKEDVVKEEEKKIKEIVAEMPKAPKDSRKEIQRTRTAREEKIEKKDEKVIPTTSKTVESVPVKLKEEKNKIDDREERIKMRELLKLDVNVTAKEETKQDVQQIKSVKIDDNQKTLKPTRREVKKEDKEEEIRLKKPLLTATLTGNSSSETEDKNMSEGSSDTSKKSRSIFSRLSVKKKSKTTAGKISRASNKQIGITKVKKTQTFKERMKAIVKRFKIKKTVKLEEDLALPQTQPPLLSPSGEISEDDKKKKPLLTSEEEKKKRAALHLEDEKKKKPIFNIDKDEEMKKKKVVSTSDKDEEKKKKSPSEEQEKVMPQLTRSKSKEEGLCVLKTRKVESVLQENRAEKKPGPPQPVGPTTPPSDADKKRGRKRKDTEREDKSNGSDEVLDLLPSYKSVSVGDKLKVYYGPTHESKVTYEAKVLNQKDEGNEQMYLVHYTGWNTRYDEWIKRSRIADNLSWNPGRAKRVRQPQQSLSRNGSKRGRRSESGGGGGRPTTPSSVTSSSSRTKSPAVSYSTVRSTRNKTRPRRISGHTDLSESESDEEYNSESDNESLIHTKLRNRIGSEVGDEDEVRRTDTDELCKDDNENKHNIEILEDRTKGINSSDEKDKEENQESVFSRMRSRSYRRKYDEKLQDLSTDKQESDDIKDDYTESLVVIETRGKKIKEEVEDTLPDELPRDRTRSRSEKRKAEEINKLQPLNPDEIKKELVVDEPAKNDRLRSRNDKRKVLDSKSDVDNENEKDNSSKDVENERECSDTFKHNKTEENEDVTDLTSDIIITKKKSRGKSEESVNLIKDASSMKEEHEDENQTKERRRSRRVTPRKDELVKSGTKDDEEQPKGRDFDLNQIRSELKGIDKAVKLPLDMPQHAKKESEPENKSTNQAEYKNKEDHDVSIKTMNATADDIYEFKEPEPFEFEVRKCNDEKGLKQMRSFGRICEDTVKKSESPVRRKIIKSKPENSPPTTDVKRRYRRNVKKDEVEIEDDVIEELDVPVSPRVHESNSSIPDNRNADKVLELVTPTKVVKEPCEEAFDKLVETPSFREVLTSVKVDDILQPLFELPGESDAVGIDEDSEGRLVISETETETEPEGPLFSHQQRDHEDLFPTLMSQQSPSNESLKNSSGVFSGFPSATEIKEDGELNKKDDDDDNDDDDDEEQEENEQDEEEEEECSITAAIQRVISHHTTDEESSDTDILHGSLISINKEEIKNEDETIPNKILAVDSESEISQEHNEEDDNKQNIDEDDDDDDLSIPLKIVEDEENTNSPIVESIILNDSLECDSKLTINECNETEDDDNDDNEENVENEDEEVIQENEENISNEKNEESESKDESEKEEENLIEIDTAKAEVEETLIEEFEDCSQQSEKGDDEDDDDMDEETIISEVMELSNDKALIVETAVIEDVVLEEVKEELILEEECEDVEEHQEEEVQVDEEDVEEKGESKEDEKENIEEVVEIKEDKVDAVKEEGEETESNFQSLLCEETIPGSPAPPTSSLVESENAGSGVTCVAELPFASAPGSSLPHYKPPAPPPPPPLPLPPPPPPPPALVPVQPALPINNEAAPVMDNTPPTTPESSLSPISNSPRGERSGSSPVPDNDSSKSHRDSSEVDMDMYQEATKIGNYSEEDTVCLSSTRIKKPTPSIDDGDSQSSKKRRRSHRRSEDNTKRPKISHRSPRHHGGSESDDTSENSLDLLSSHSRSPRPSKYNFYVQLDPELDGSQRIAVLQQKLAELRKTYMSVKTELACIDRRRKKLRRREREEKSLKPELSCS